jgi:hypothetical protein
LNASDFVLPKNVQASNKTASNSNLLSAKKIKESILEQISQILKFNLIGLDRILIDLRVLLQDEVELGLCGEHDTLINSSSRSERQAYLDLITQLNLELVTSMQVVEQKIKEIKALNFKAKKLKG